MLQSGETGIYFFKPMYWLIKISTSWRNNMKEKKKRDTVPVLIKLDRELFEFLNELAKSRYSNRTAEVRRLILQEMGNERHKS